MFVRPCRSIPSSIITARRRSASGRFISRHNRSRVRCVNIPDAADFDVDRASASTRSPTGSCARRYRRVETPASIRSNATSSKLVALGEVLIGPERQLRLAIGRPSARPLDRNPPTAERHLASPHDHDGQPYAPGSTCPPGPRPPRPPAPKAPRAPRARPRPTTPTAPPSLPPPAPQRVLHPLREHAHITDRLDDRYGLESTAVPPSDLCPIARHTPTTSGRAGPTAVTSKFHEPSGQPPAVGLGLGSHDGIDGTIDLDGEQSCARPGRRDRFATPAITPSARCSRSLSAPGHSAVRRAPRRLECPTAHSSLPASHDRSTARAVTSLPWSSRPRLSGCGSLETARHLPVDGSFFVNAEVSDSRRVAPDLLKLSSQVGAARDSGFDPMVSNELASTLPRKRGCPGARRTLM